MNNVEYPCIKCGKKYYLNNYFNIGANRSLKLVEWRNCQMLWMKNPEICLGCNL